MARIKYSIGNKKIGRDTIIINMEPSLQCSAGKAGLCPLYLKGCYAHKSERLYPQVMPFRRAQRIIWRDTDAESIAQQIRAVNARKRNKIRYLRLNEAGDFPDQEAVRKASRIASLLQSDGIRVYTYTHRRDLDFSGVSQNLVINGSGFMLHNEFRTVDKVTSRVFCAGDCRTCKICMKRRNVIIEVKKH